MVEFDQAGRLRVAVGINEARHNQVASEVHQFALRSFKRENLGVRAQPQNAAATDRHRLLN